MVWSNYQNFWLTALLLIGAVLPLVHGEYATCPTTIGRILVKKADLQNAASYEEQRCTGGDKCCAEKDSNSRVTIQVMCSPSCTSAQVDCSEAANRCRDVADVTEYYKSSDFITCPFYATGTLHDMVSVVWSARTVSRNTVDILCPATDTCSVARFIYRWVQYGIRYFPLLLCMNTCKRMKADWMRGQTRAHKIITPDCTACSSTEDCTLKVDKIPRCPTTKGRRLRLKEEIEAATSYEEKPCTDSDKCCEFKTTRGRLEIEVKCSAFCASPLVDCIHESNHCSDLADIRRHVSSDYVSCLSLKGLNNVEWTTDRNRRWIVPEFKTFESVLCPSREKCAAVRIEYTNEKYYPLAGYKPIHLRWSLAFAGCLIDCEYFVNSHQYPNFCRECSTTDDCRNILKFNRTIMPHLKPHSKSQHIT